MTSELKAIELVESLKYDIANLEKVSAIQLSAFRMYSNDGLHTQAGNLATCYCKMMLKLENLKKNLEIVEALEHLTIE